MLNPYLDPTLAKYFAKASSKFQFDQPARDLVALARIGDSQKLLDVGSGTGLIASGASEKIGRTGLVAALDGSIEMLRQQPDAIVRIAAKAQELPFENGVFDRITAGFVITHLPDYTKGLSEWLRVLRAGGCMVASAWEVSPLRVSDIWKGTIGQFVDLSSVEKEFARVIPFDTFFSVSANFTRAIEQSGFTNVEAETKNYLISMTLHQYIETKIGSVEGTIVRNRLNESSWTNFLQVVFSNLQKEFPERIEYPRKAHFVRGQKPGHPASRTLSPLRGSIRTRFHAQG